MLVLTTGKKEEDDRWASVDVVLRRFCASTLAIHRCRVIYPSFCKRFIKRGAGVRSEKRKNKGTGMAKKEYLRKLEDEDEIQFSHDTDAICWAPGRTIGNIAVSSEEAFGMFEG